VAEQAVAPGAAYGRPGDRIKGATIRVSAPARWHSSAYSDYGSAVRVNADSV